MKVITTVKLMAVFMLAAMLTACAQGTGGGTNANNGQGGGQGGSSGANQGPSPEHLAQVLLTNFDANKDGELTQDELTKALEDMRQRHPINSGGASQGGQNSPPSADKIAAGMIQDFSSDKKGLTQTELEKAFADRQAKRAAKQGGTNTNSRSN